MIQLKIVPNVQKFLQNLTFIKIYQPKMDETEFAKFVQKNFTMKT